MNNYDLSVIIPARNEEFLARTIQDILEKKRAKTEIIAVLDGKWANPPIEDHPDVTIIYLPESVGQRAATNIGARLSRAKFIMKLDAHCSWDEGYDLKMIEGFDKVGDNVTMVGIMKNLHIYDWKCYKCGKKVYQDVKPICPNDGTQMKKKMIWQPRRGTHATAYRFDAEPHFQYWSEYTQRPEYKKDLEETGFTESFSLQGSCFMMTREKYMEFAIGREELGSWGNEGLEIACKTWLSGGRVLVNHGTHYAHCFRTKGDVFGFPYPQSGNEVSRTKQRVKDLFWNNKWDKQIYPLSWLIERFWEIPGWSENQLKELKENEKKIWETKVENTPTNQ